MRLTHQNESSNNGLLERAVRLAQQGDRREAVPLLKQLVDEGESIANCNLGAIYENGGAGLSQNFETSRFYYQKAAEDGWVPGCIGLGRIYYHGLGVEQDLHKAFEYFNLIHRIGVASPIADCYLGQIYFLGESVDRDVSRALFFLSVPLSRDTSGHARDWQQSRLLSGTLASGLGYGFLSFLRHSVLQSGMVRILGAPRCRRKHQGLAH